MAGIKLSEGCIMAMMQGETVSKPILQVTNIRPISSASGPQRYRLLMSDGINTLSSFMLATQLNSLVDDFSLASNCICQVNRFIMNTLKDGRRVVVVVELEVLKSAELVGGKIGNPVPYNEGCPATGNTSQSRHQKSTQTQEEASREESPEDLDDGELLGPSEQSGAPPPQVDTGATITPPPVTTSTPSPQTCAPRSSILCSPVLVSQDDDSTAATGEPGPSGSVQGTPRAQVTGGSSRRRRAVAQRSDSTPEVQTLAAIGPILGALKDSHGVMGQIFTTLQEMKQVEADKCRELAGIHQELVALRENGAARLEVDVRIRSTLSSLVGVLQDIHTTMSRAPETSINISDSHRKGSPATTE